MRNIIIILLGFVLMACTEKENSSSMIGNNSSNSNNNNSGQNNQEPPMDKSTYLALGDSYTIGQSVAIEERFPVQLSIKLSSNGIPMEAARIIARTGWSTGQLISAIEEENIQETFDLVSLLIGVNNQYRGRDTAEYRMEFRQLLQTAIEFADGNEDHVLVLSIPDYGPTPFAQNSDTVKIAREIDAFNAINLQETRKTDAQYFNITGISRKARTESGLIAQDGLHPSAEMYRQWVELIFPAAREILSQE
jgi:lysophospholipase L1-like esterase